MESYLDVVPLPVPVPDCPPEVTLQDTVIEQTSDAVQPLEETEQEADNAKTCNNPQIEEISVVSSSV